MFHNEQLLLELRAESQNSHIMNLRPSYTPKQYLSDIFLNTASQTKTALLHLAFFLVQFFWFVCSYLQSPAIQLPALIGLNSLWLNLLIQNSYYCCSSVSGFPSLHSFGVFQTSCCRYQNESCWQALFDTCKIQWVPGQIRKQRCQEK